MVAITRQVSSHLADCELTHLDRSPVDVELAARQHQDYEAVLTALGCGVVSLPPTADLPDSVFVEDTAVVLDELAVITRPGAVSRRGETASIAAALAPHRKLVTIAAPACLDGGDVLQCGRILYAGISSRSNREGIEQLQQVVSPYGYEVRAVELRDCLHLKTAVTAISPDTLLINPAWADKRHFTAMRFIEVDPAEPYAANAVMVNGSVLYAAAHVRTRELIESFGYRIACVDMSETAKAEGGVTCCSLLFTVKPGGLSEPERG